MKKSLLFAAAALIACSASAEVIAPRPIEGLTKKQLRAEYEQSRQHKQLRANAAKAGAPARGAEVTPEGEAKTYAESGYFYSPYGLYYSTLPNTVCEAPDGNTVYFNSIFPADMADIWTAATVEGDQLTISSETIVGSYYGVYDLTVAECVFDESGESIVGFKDLVLVKEGDTYYMEDDDIDPERFAALCASVDGEFAGLVSFGLLLTFEPVEYGDPVTLPEGAEPSKYFYEYTTWGGIKTAEKALGYIDGTDMYLNNLTALYTDGWVKGTIEGNQVTFPAGQFMGISGSYFFFFNPFTYEGDNPATLTGVYTPADLVFNISEDGVLTQANPEVYSAYTTSPSMDDLYNYSSNYTVTPYTEVLFGIPTDPSNLNLIDYWDYFGQNCLTYNLVTVGTNGNFLEPDNYYYTIYLDDEPYAVGPDNYEYVSEEMVEIPVNYFDEYGGNDIAPGFIYFPENMFETVGVQGIYYFNGQPYYSNIVSTDMEGNIYVTEVENGDPINISTIYSAANNQKVIYNAMGQKVNKAERGFNIVNGKKHIIK